MPEFADHASTEAAWHGFVENAEGEIQHIRPVTLQAWQRCRELDIDPRDLTFTFLSDDELTQRQQKNADLIAAAEPYLEHLSLTLSGKPHVVVLSDRDGWIIAMRGTPEAFGGSSSGIAPGSSWAEHQIGNNGIGTALSLEKPVLIHGVEHFAQAYHPATCLGVPIRVDDTVIGALDISVLNRDADPARLTLAQACVASIESALAAQSQWRRDSGPSKDEQIAAVNQLLAGTVHDFKHPLTSMRMIGQLGERAASDDQTRRYFEMVQEQVDRLREMVEELLRQDDRRKIVTSPASVIEPLLGDVQALCDDNGIQVNLNIRSSAHATLEPGLFRRAVQNVVMNAVEAMPNGGKLDVLMIDDEGAVRISVSDTGPGIPPEIQDQIFEPFVGARSGGTGLGLSTAYQTVTEVHQGRLWFSTEPGNGTTFFIEIPAVVHQPSFK